MDKPTNPNQDQEMNQEIVPLDSGIAPVERQSLESAFAPFFEQTRTWADQIVHITDPSLARSARLELRKIRVAADKVRKDLKADALRMGKAIDGANNILLAALVPLEQQMADIEKEEERKMAAKKEALKVEREDALRPFVNPNLPLPDVLVMTEDQFNDLLHDSKVIYQLRVDAARKVEEERIEAEEVAAAERARIEAENAKLKAEAAKARKIKAAQALKVKKAKEKASKAAADKLEAERIKVEAERKAERESWAALQVAEAQRISNEAKRGVNSDGVTFLEKIDMRVRCGCGEEVAVSVQALSDGSDYDEIKAIAYDEAGFSEVGDCWTCALSSAQEDLADQQMRDRKSNMEGEFSL